MHIHTSTLIVITIKNINKFIKFCAQFIILNLKAIKISTNIELIIDLDILVNKNNKLYKKQLHKLKIK